MRIAGLLVMAATFSSVLAPTSATAQSTQERLDRAKDSLGHLKAEAERTADAFASTERRLGETTSLISRTKTAIGRTQADMATLRVELEGRIRAMYKLRGIGFFDVFLGARSLRDFSTRVAAVRRQTLQDERLIQELRRKRHELELGQGELARQQEELESRKGDYQEEGRRLTATLEQANETIGALKGQLSREQAARLFTVKSREAAAPAAPDSPSNEEGSVPATPSGGQVVRMAACPVDPPRVVTNSFGAPRDGGRRHAGNDIMAPMGVPVRAVNAGTIRSTGNGEVAGVSFYLWDGSTEYYYAHLDTLSVETGQAVAAGQVVGTNGNSGNANGGPPHVHFEVHPGGGAAIDPYPSLSSAC